MDQQVRFNIIYKLNILANRFPKQRIGQLILNSCRGHPTWPDIFNLSDEELYKALNWAEISTDTDK